MSPRQPDVKPPTETTALNSIPPPTDPPPPSLRHLLILCLLTVGPHFGKHALSSLLPQVLSVLSLSAADAGLLFSAQELPGVFVPLLGGIALSSTALPLHITALFLAVLVFLGQALTASAIQSRSYALLIFSRFLFGLGDGLLVVVQGAIVGARFKDSSLSSAFGIMLFASRASSYTGLVLPVVLSTTVGLIPALYAIALICLISPLAAIFLPTPPPSASTVSPTAILALPRALPRAFYLLALLWALLASSIFTLLHFAAAISTSSSLPALTSHTALASALSASILLISAVLSPPLGYLQDVLNRRLPILRTTFFLAATGLALASYATHIDTSPALYVAAVALIAAAFAAAPVTLLSAIALVVDDAALLPAALALYKSAENAVMAATHWAAGALRDATGTYAATLLFLAAIAAAGMPVVYALARTEHCSALTGLPPPASRAGGPGGARLRI